MVWIISPPSSQQQPPYRVIGWHLISFSRNSIIENIYFYREPLSLRISGSQFLGAWISSGNVWRVQRVQGGGMLAPAALMPSTAVPVTIMMALLDCYCWIVFQSSWSPGLGSLRAEKAEMWLPVSFGICLNRGLLLDWETSQRFVSSSMPDPHSPMPGCRPPSCRSWRRTRTRSSSPRHPPPPRPRWPARTRSCCSSPAQKYYEMREKIFYIYRRKIFDGLKIYTLRNALAAVPTFIISLTFWFLKDF